MITCARPACGEPVYSWLHPRYCTRSCANLDQHPDVDVLADPELHADDTISVLPKPDEPARTGWLARLLERLFG